MHGAIEAATSHAEALRREARNRRRILDATPESSPRTPHQEEPVARHDTPVIATYGLSKRYGDVQALESLDLHVPRHAIVGFLGPNGAGKSTAMKVLLGLTRPTSGGGTIFGRDLVRDSLEIRRRVGYLAQEPRFDGHRTARQTLRFAGRFFLPDDAALAARVERSLALVGLEDKADRPVRGFSGGERQRLGLAQAQIHDPELLILDEPAASLDPLRLLERLRERATILYATHILDDVERVSDHVAILDRGRLVRQAPTRELLAEAAPAIRVAAPLAVMVPVRSSLGVTPGPGRILLAFGGLMLVLAFFLSLTLLLGTIFASRTAVAGGAFTVLFVATQFTQALPQLLPTGIPLLLAEGVQGGALGSPTPFLITLVACGAFLWIAGRRFARMEL